MATHIFTVNEKTFKTHLNYMFAGTGKDVAEHQTGALADILGSRTGDKVCFYVMNRGFFGFFKVKEKPFLENYQNQYLDQELEKTLTYRVFIEPEEVYQNYKSEWDVIENPQYIKGKSIYNLQWGWIFKKLNANRGCLSIDNYEEELLYEIISLNNIKLSHGKNYNYSNGKISVLNDDKKYEGDTSRKLREDHKIVIEEDLRILFTSEANESEILDIVLNKKEYGKINFISNEVLCSFSERKLDLVFGTEKNYCLLIELKNNFVFNDKIYNQLKEYSRWISSYKTFYKKLIPILIIREAKILSKRKNSIYYKYLSHNDLEYNNVSPWYSEIIIRITKARDDLKNENIDNLSDLQVFCFETDDTGKLLKFNKII